MLAVCHWDFFLCMFVTQQFLTVINPYIIKREVGQIREPHAFIINAVSVWFHRNRWLRKMWQDLESTVLQPLWPKVLYIDPLLYFVWILSSCNMKEPGSVRLQGWSVNSSAGDTDLMLGDLPDENSSPRSLPQNQTQSSDYKVIFQKCQNVNDGKQCVTENGLAPYGPHWSIHHIPWNNSCNSGVPELNSNRQERVSKKKKVFLSCM